MNNLLKSIYFVLLVMFSGTLLAQNDTRPTQDQDQIVDAEKRQSLINDAEEAKRVMSQNNQNVADLFERSAGYAIFPNVGKGAYILGGAAGNGVVYENGERVGFAELRQVDIGLQIGGQAFREVIFFETQAALDRFKQGNFELEGNASAVIIEEGKSKSITFQDGVAVATMPKAGAMVELSVGGQKFNYGSIE